MVVLVVRPHLAVDVRELRRHHRVLGAVGLQLFRDRIDRGLLGLAVDLGDEPLIHAGAPDITVRIGLDLQKAFRFIRLEGRECVIGHLAGRRIELADELMSEIRVPGMPVGRHDGVVRHRLRTRQIVGGDDDMRGAALRARQRLERIAPVRPLAEIDAGEIFGGPSQLRLVARRFVGLARAGHERLRKLRRAAVGIGRHARNDLHPFVGGVGRIDDALQRMAIGAAEAVARHAVEPIAVAELVGQLVEVGHLLERDVGRRGSTAGNIRRPAVLQPVAHRADGDVVVSRLQPGSRKGVVALLVGNHGRGDGRARLFGADQHAFHRPFLRRAHRSVQGDRSHAGVGLGMHARRAHERAGEHRHRKAMRGQESLPGCNREILCADARSQPGAGKSAAASLIVMISDRSRGRQGRGYFSVVATSQPRKPVL